MLNSGCNTNMATSFSNSNTAGSNRSGKHRKDDSKGTDGQIKPKRSSNSFSQRRDSKEDGSRKLRDSFSDVKRISESELFENWLEVRCTTLGPILLEGALPIPDHKLHIVQHNFLREHDVKSKRLWFLWSGNSASTEIARCGCIGGCAFFGSNRNGTKFFKPSAQDVQDNYNIARYHIIDNPKDFGFGESILHEGQLVFHTPPYSLQTVSLHDSSDFTGKGKHYRPAMDIRYGSLKKSEIVSKEIGAGKFKVAEKASELNGRKSRESIGSPNTLERRSQRYSYTTTKQNSVEVPYARLLDSPSKKIMRQESNESQTMSLRRGSDSKSQSLRISPPKTSVSDSRLTGDGTAEDDIEIPEEMSHSAPHSHPLEFEVADIPIHHIDGNGDSLTREVQITISLTSENPSEMFFSAEEDISNVISQCSIVFSGKKRFSSDLSIGAQNDAGGLTLSTYRSDLEIHAAENNKTLPKRPQSTMELFSSNTYHSITHMLIKFCF